MLQWLEEHPGIATWLAGAGTTGALVWALWQGQTAARAARRRALAALYLAIEPIAVAERIIQACTSDPDYDRDTEASDLQRALPRLRTMLSDVESFTIDTLPTVESVIAFERCRDELRLTLATIEVVGSTAGRERRNSAISAKACGEALGKRLLELRCTALPVRHPYTWRMRDALRHSAVSFGDVGERLKRRRHWARGLAERK